MTADIVCLTGGVGGAKLARGLSATLPAERLAFVVNSGDDFTHLGLEIWPDFDTLVYTLVGLADPQQGWGRRDESWNFHAELAQQGGETWFRLGDRDLALHILRTERLCGGWSRADVADRIAGDFGLGCTIFRAAMGELATIIRTAQGPLSFQQYFVAERAEPAIEAIDYLRSGPPGPDPRLAAILSAPHLQGVLIAPSNPLLSVGPILAVEGMRALVAGCHAPVVAISPIIAGNAVKGPTARNFRDLGLEVSALGVARCYQGLIDAMLIDDADAASTGAIEELGIACRTAPIIMRDDGDKARVAAASVALLAEVAARTRAA